MDKLTVKQQRFIDEYVVCLNGTEAARRAKYEGDDATLAVVASQNLRKHYIVSAINERLNQFAMPANEVLVHLTDIARGDIADVVNGVGATDLDEAKLRGKSHLVKKYKVKVTNITEGTGKDTVERQIIETEVEMYSRLDALQTLAKFHNLTNTVRIEDWRTELLALIRDNKVQRQEVETEFGYDVAEELFITAGVLSSTSRED